MLSDVLSGKQPSGWPSTFTTLQPVLEDFWSEEEMIDETHLQTERQAR